MKNLLITYFIFFLLASLPVFLFKSENIVVFCNSIESSILDNISKLGLTLGSFWFFMIFVTTIVFAYSSLREEVFAGLSFFLTSIVVLFLKKYFVNEAIRPHALIPKSQLIFRNYFLDESLCSFPSGHASTIAVIVTVLLLLLKIKNSFFIFNTLLLAYFLSLTRVYVAMHFYHDIFVGSLLGCFCTIFSYKIIYGYANLKILDLNVTDLLKKNL